MTEEELKEAELKLAREKFDFEKEKAARESRFFYRNSATVITGTISLAVICVSLIQVWIANINRQTEVDDARTERQRVADVGKLESERRWRLESLKFVSDNKKEIFEGTQDQKLTMCRVLSTTFPQEITDVLFARFGGNSFEEHKFWREVCQRQAEGGYTESVLVGEVAPSRDELQEAVADPGSIAELVEKFKGPERRAASATLAELAKSRPADVVNALIAAILPPEDPMSYRENLYIALTLGRIEGGWRASDEQYRRVEGLRKTDNYSDPTFRTQVDAALKNFKKD
ncbi:MAG TPA: hypothetical protein VM914_08355 [Pyrinomonadaceae bacterium]|jgi:hypothetical protein|nr:hypothetical protein [Pyrinomonadaceae bacterium]